FYERYDWVFLTMVTTEEQSCARI
ncbi:GNAT family N-acetyltransferase, partial [Enterococcus faecalis]